MEAIKRKTIANAILIIFIAVIFIAIIVAGLFNYEKGADINSTYTVGTADNPIEISSAEDFATLLFNNDAYYVQTQDIDLSAFQNFQGVSGYFRGHYDGQRYRLFNVNISKDDSDGGVGLFNINLGTITNVIIQSGRLEGGSHVGAIASANLGRIEGCTSFADVVGDGPGVGGIAGSNSGEIIRCSNRGNISNSAENYYTGGIVGSNLSNIKYCYNAGNINGGYQSGGIAGNNDGKNGVAEIEECYNIGNVDGKIKASICADNWQGNIDNVVYPSELGNKAMAFNTGTTDNVAEASLDNMKSQAAFGNWKTFSDNWMFIQGYDYPSLKSEFVQTEDIEFTEIPSELKRGHQYPLDFEKSPSSATPNEIGYEIITGKNAVTINEENNTLDVNSDAEIGAQVVLKVRIDQKEFLFNFTIGKNPVTSVTLTSPTTSIVYQDEIELSATVLPEDATYKNVSYIYNDEYVNIIDNKVSLKRGCPDGYTFKVVAIADGVESNEVVFTVSVIGPEDVVFLQGDSLEMIPGGKEDLEQRISVTPANAQYKFIELVPIGDSTPITIENNTQINVDFMAQQGSYEIGVKFDDVLMDSSFTVVVNYPDQDFDFYINTLYLHKGTRQPIQYRFYNAEESDVAFELTQPYDGIQIVEEADGIQYIEVASDTSVTQFSIKATYGEGNSIVKDFEITIPLESINIAVNEDCEKYCQEVSNENDTIVFNILPNKQFENDETKLNIMLNPINTSFNKIRYTISEHEEIVKTDVLEGNVLRLKLYQLTKTLTAEGTPKQFKVVVYAGDCSKTLIFKVQPIEVAAVVYKEVNGKDLNNMYIGNTYEIELSPSAYATDLEYQIPAQLENVPEIQYSVNGNRIYIAVVANPSQNKTISFNCAINGCSTTINLGLKVAAESVDLDYKKFNDGKEVKLEAGATIELDGAVSPSNANDKTLVYRVNKGAEKIESSYLLGDSDGYYIRSNEEGKYIFKLKAGSLKENESRDVEIIAVAHNGVASAPFSFVVKDTEIENIVLKVYSQSENGVQEYDLQDNSAGTGNTYSLKQNKAVSLKAIYYPEYFKGDVQYIFRKDQLSWFAFSGKEVPENVGDEYIYTIKEGNVNLIENFKLTREARVGENLVVGVKVGDCTKQFDIKVDYEIEMISDVSNSDTTSYLNLPDTTKYEDIESIEVWMIIGNETFSYYKYETVTSDPDLSKMVCFTKPDRIVIKYNMNIKNTQGDIEFTIDQIIEKVDKTLIGEEAEALENCPEGITRVMLSNSNNSLSGESFFVPAHVEDIYIKGNTKIISMSLTIRNNSQNKPINIYMDGIDFESNITSYYERDMNIYFSNDVNWYDDFNLLYVNGKLTLEGMENVGKVNITTTTSTVDTFDGGNPIICKDLVIKNMNNLTINGGNGYSFTEEHPSDKDNNGEAGAAGVNSGDREDANGKDGGNGSPCNAVIHNGTDGSAAVKCSTLTIENSQVTFNGGDGGRGSAGGHGGDGGAGGNGAETAFRKPFVSQDAGDGGNGGDGAKGDNGGAGGNGAKAVDVESNITINNSVVIFIGGDGGDGGDGGNGGDGGAGGKGGADTQTVGDCGNGGDGGDGGDGGVGGAAGKAGEKITNYQSSSSTVTSTGGSNGVKGTSGSGGDGGAKGLKGNDGAHTSSKKSDGQPGTPGNTPQ